MSSAHIYLRLREGQQWDSLQEDLVVDLAQLTKANSIEGERNPGLQLVYIIVSRNFAQVFVANNCVSILWSR